GPAVGDHPALAALDAPHAISCHPTPTLSAVDGNTEKFSTRTMKIHSALSRSADTAEAASSVCREVAIAIGDHGVDLAFVFFSPDHVPSLSALINIVQYQLRPKVLLGCSAESIIE